KRPHFVRFYVDDFGEDLFHAVAAALRAARTRRTATRLHLLLPYGENLCFVLRRKTGTQLRLAISRLGFEPGERVARSFCERPECQPFAQRALDLCASQSALSASPHGHIGPRLHFLPRKKIFCHPCECRFRFHCGFGFIKHAAHAERFRWASCVVNSSLAVLDHADRPFGEVAGINELHRVARRTRRKNFAAAIDPYRPVCEAIGLVAWADDEPWADDQCFSRKPFFGFAFGERFEWTVGFVTARLHRLERLLVRIGAFIFFCRRGLVRTGLYFAVNGNRRDKDVALNVAFENLRRAAHPRGKRRRIVDGDVPLSIFQRVQLAVSIANQLFDFVRQFAWVRFAAVERRDLMSATKRVANLVWSSEPCAAKNENAKRFHRFLCEQRGRSRSEGKCAASGSGKFDELTARPFHVAANLSCHSERS